MNYRHECKHIISASDALLLTNKLKRVLKKDEHSDSKGEYLIRSIYFDNEDNHCLNEKINGMQIHQKFRIRFYNMDTSYIALEKKIRNNSLSKKVGTRISLEEVNSIMRGDINFLLQSGDQLKQELYYHMTNKLLHPRCIVDYTRTVFVCKDGNIRITLDRNIKTTLSVSNILVEPNQMFCIEPTTNILEVKYDAFFPDFVRDIIQMGSIQTSSFSKYSFCRTFHN